MQMDMSIIKYELQPHTSILNQTSLSFILLLFIRISLPSLLEMMISLAR